MVPMVNLQDRPSKTQSLENVQSVKLCTKEFQKNSTERITGLRLEHSQVVNQTENGAAGSADSCGDSTSVTYL